MELKKCAVAASESMRTVQARHLYAHGRKVWITIRFGTSRPIAPSERHAERNQRRRRQSHQERLVFICKSTEHARALEAAEVFLEAKILYGPAKAANAGGRPGLEMAQNSSAHELDPAKRSTISCIGSVTHHSQKLLRDRRNLRHLPQYNDRRQHRRLLKGRQCDDETSGDWCSLLRLLDHKGVDAVHARIFLVANVMDPLLSPRPMHQIRKSSSRHSRRSSCPSACATLC